jgi:hypothetical protein
VGIVKFSDFLKMFCVRIRVVLDMELKLFQCKTAWFGKITGNYGVPIYQSDLDFLFTSWVNFVVYVA